MKIRVKHLKIGDWFELLGVEYRVSAISDRIQFDYAGKVHKCYPRYFGLNSMQFVNLIEKETPAHQEPECAPEIKLKKPPVKDDRKKSVPGYPVVPKSLRAQFKTYNY